MNAAYILLLPLFFNLNGFSAGTCTGNHSSLLNVTFALAGSNETLLLHGTDDEQVVIKGAWLQQGPPSQKMTAAYMLIENHGANEIELLSAHTEIANVVELHQMRLEDGMMRMRRVDSIRIPAGASVELKPGGYHLMVIGLKKEIKDGEVVPFVLQFSAQITKTINVPVKRRDTVS